jgi:LacI family gluconate utilization system Gnt-I transcriptional repressor
MQTDGRLVDLRVVEAWQTWIPMTTVQIRGRAIGERAAEIVFERLKGKEADQSVHDIGYSLMIRKST